MKKIVGILLGLLLVFEVALGQFLFDIDHNADFIELDNLENIYVVKGSELIKYNSAGEFLYRYSNKIHGVITSLDATNPLRIILFYNESNTLAFLNQQLALISDPIDIFDVVNIQVSAAGASNQGFWVFCIDRQNIMLFNSKVETIQESQNLSAWIKGENIQFIREHNQKIYLGLNGRVLVFDVFGLYLTTLHFEGSQFLKMIGDKFSYLKGKEIWVYNPELKSEVGYLAPNFVESKAVYCYKNRIYLINKKGISIFKCN
jgi:hypothetical protein